MVRVLVRDDDCIDEFGLMADESQPPGQFLNT
jgi:hypothetical protein